MMRTVLRPERLPSGTSGRKSPAISATLLIIKKGAVRAANIASLPNEYVEGLWRDLVDPLILAKEYAAALVLARELAIAIHQFRLQGDRKKLDEFLYKYRAHISDES